MKESNIFFGYSDVDENEGDSSANPTAFFKYGEVDDALKAKAHGYKEHNRITLAKNKQKLEKAAERKLKRSNSKETEEGGNSCMLESMPQHMFKTGTGLSKLNRLPVEMLSIKERNAPVTMKKEVKLSASEGSADDTSKLATPAVQV